MWVWGESANHNSAHENISAVMAVAVVIIGTSLTGAGVPAARAATGYKVWGSSDIACTGIKNDFTHSPKLD